MITDHTVVCLGWQKEFLKVKTKDIFWVLYWYALQLHTNGLLGFVAYEVLKYISVPQFEMILGDAKLPTAVNLCLIHML